MNEFKCDVDIVVRGRTGSGKSHVAALISRMLEELGVRIKIEDSDPDAERTLERIREGIKAMDGSRALIRQQSIGKPRTLRL